MKREASLSIGDFVYIKRFKVYGIIVEQLDEEQYRVETEQYHFTLDQQFLTKVEDHEIKDLVFHKGVDKKSSYRQYVSNRIDIHGYDKIEAKIAIKQFIQEAVHYQLKTVEIVHGKGTGILKNVVHDLLRQYKSQNIISHYQFASVFDGGHGVTVVYL